MSSVKDPNLAKLSPPAASLLGLVEEFFITRAPRKDSAHTQAAYRRDLRFVAEELAKCGTAPLAQLSSAHLTAANLRQAFAGFAQQRSAASVRRAWSVWHTFCDFLVSEDILPGNPMGAVRRPRPPRVLPKPLVGERTPEQLLEAIAAGARKARNPWPERDLAVVATLLLTGLRSAEMLGLRVESLAGRVGERRLAVVGKGDRYRSVPLEEPLYQLIGAYLASRQHRFAITRLAGEDALFVGDGGQGLTRGQMRYLVEQSYRFAGVRDRVQRGALVHALRHTFATRLAEDGASIVEIQRLLGHTSLAASQVYIDSTGQDQRSAAGANRTYSVIRRLADRHRSSE